MAENICFNGESAVHGGSKGKLTSSDTCMTPPFCVPIPYTNLAESLMADLTISSVNICNFPACNQESNFKISTGDAPGACAGVASGSIGQKTKFLEGLKTISLGGKAAVSNGTLKNANLENSTPQPLQQPPAQKPPEGTAEAPVEEKGEFSQQFDFSNLIGLVPGEQVVLERPNYKITDKEGKQSWEGTLTNEGLTDRIFTPEKTELVAWLGDGEEWRIHWELEQTTGEPDDSKQSAKETANIGMVFFNAAGAHLTDLDYKLVAGDKTITAKTDGMGAAQTLKDIKLETPVEILVMNELTKEYKKIHTFNALAGKSHYWVISPKVKAEAATAQHQNKPAAAPAAPPAAATKPTEIKAPPQKVETVVTLDAANNPKASFPQKNILPLLSILPMGVLGTSLYWTSKYFSSSKQLGGNPKINPATNASMAKVGTPLSDDDLEKVKSLTSYAERQVKFNYKEYTKAHNATKTLEVLAEYEKAYKNNPNTNAQPAFGAGGSKGASAFNGWCLAYVKIALMHTKMINGYPEAGVAKKSVKDWPKFGYTEISKSSDFPQVNITYHGVYSDKDSTKIKQHITDKEEAGDSYKALQAKTQVADKAVAKLQKAATACNDKINKLGKLKKPTAADQASLAAEQKNKVALDAELGKARAEANTAKENEAQAKQNNASAQETVSDDKSKARNNKFELTTTTLSQPDLLYTLPGDIIVYEVVIKGETTVIDGKQKHKLDSEGHIDIRTIAQTFHPNFHYPPWATVRATSIR